MTQFVKILLFSFPPFRITERKGYYV
jgi:hypothetical protein